MFVICVPVVVFTAGFGLLLTAPICAVIGYRYARANASNKQLLDAKN